MKKHAQVGIVCIKTSAKTFWITLSIVGWHITKDQFKVCGFYRACIIFWLLPILSSVAFLFPSALCLSCRLSQCNAYLKGSRNCGSAGEEKQVYRASVFQFGQSVLHPMVDARYHRFDQRRHVSSKCAKRSGAWFTKNDLQWSWHGLSRAPLSGPYALKHANQWQHDRGLASRVGLDLI